MRFQFHKVRLKDLSCSQFSEFMLFQFHKVRLKDLGTQKVKKLAVFQFHKVRLKVIKIYLFGTHKLYFNSIRYD